MRARSHFVGLTFSRTPLKFYTKTASIIFSDAPIADSLPAHISYAK